MDNEKKKDIPIKFIGDAKSDIRLLKREDKVHKIILKINYLIKNILLYFYLSLSILKTQ